MVSSIRRPFVTILFVHGLITVRLGLVFVIFRLVIVLLDFLDLEILELLDVSQEAKLDQYLDNRSREMDCL